MKLLGFGRLKAKKQGSQKSEPTGDGTAPPTENSADVTAEHKTPASQEGMAEADSRSRFDSENPALLISEALSQRAGMLEQSNKIHRRTVLGLLGLNIITGIGFLHASAREKEFLYFFTNTDGSVIDAKPMSDPIHSQAVVRNFLSTSIAELFSFHYRNVEMQLQRMAPEILTDNAFRDVVAELDRMGLVRDMKTYREVAVATIPDTPVLQASGDLNGVFTWEYASRINIMLEGAERSSGNANRGTTRRLSGQLRAQLIRVAPEVHPRRVLINRLQIFEENA